MKRYCIQCVAILLVVSGCFGNAHYVGGDTLQQKTRIFYRALADKVLTYQEFKIIDDKIALNYMDMEWRGYHISEINNLGCKHYEFDRTEQTKPKI